MKNSGIEWIGESPKDWHVSHLKYVCSFKTGETPSNKVGIGSTGDYQWITPSDLGDSFLVETSNQYITHEAVTINHYKLFPTNSILLVCIASVGKVGIIDKQSYANQQITALIPNNIINPKFLMYSMSAASSQIQFDASSNVVPIINIKYLENFSFTYPNIKYQRIISDILDQKCSEIDAITKDIQAQIDTLEQYKRSVITEAVTTGLDPDVEMKDSGIDWIGKIPTTWNVIKIKRLLEERKEHSLNGTEEPLSMSQKYGLIPTKDMDMVSHQAASNVGAKLAYKNDLVFNKLKAHLGVFSVSKYDGLVSPDYAVYYSKGNCNVKYLEYLFKTDIYINEFKKRITGVGAGLSRLYTSGLFDIYGIYPPLTDQDKIAAFIDNKTNEINLLIREKEQQLETLSNYKKSLIYEYVTGKKEVPAE